MESSASEFVERVDLLDGFTCGRLPAVDRGEHTVERLQRAPGILRSASWAAIRSLRDGGLTAQLP